MPRIISLVQSVMHAGYSTRALDNPWTENIDLGRVGRKPVNANPGLNVN